MTSMRTPDDKPAQPQYVNKMFRLRPEAAQAFEFLKAEVGPRSGPPLAAEMIDLLLIEHGKKPVGPLRPGAGAKRPASKPKPGA